MENTKETIEFKVGDVVRLKSNTIKMVIEDMPSQDEALCVWHYKNNPYTQTYKTMVLVHDKPLGLYKQKS